MSEQETNQELLDDEANLEVEQDAKPVKGSVEPGTKEPKSGAEESPTEPSQEELAELIEIGRRTKAANITDPEAFMRDYTQKSQMLPKLQDEQERAMEVIRKLAGERAAAQDPLEAARQRLIEAENGYDPIEKVAAYEHYQNVRDQQREQAIIEKSLRAGELKLGLERAKAFGDYTPQQLGEVPATMTPEEMALVRRYRQGDLPDVLNADMERRKAAAERKARINQMFGQGSGGVVPGSFEEPPVPTIEWANFVTELTKEQQKELLEQGVKILNAPGSD